MSKILKTMKAKMLDIGLKFLSIDEKIAYITFNTKTSYVKDIVLLPTTNSTIKKLKKRMKDAQRIGNIINGTLNGTKVTIIRAGVGAPHTAMVMEALKRSPCKVAIRVDYCGGLKTVDKDLDVADVIIPKEVFLTDGTCHSYLHSYSKQLDSEIKKTYPIKTNGNSTQLMQYPSYKGNYCSFAPSPLLSEILKNTSNSKVVDFKIKPGKLWSVDALFCETEAAINTWKSYGATSVDMESSIVYLLGKLFNIHTISILGISDLPDTEEWNFQKTNKMHPKYEFILDNAIDILIHSLPEIHKKVKLK